MLLIGTVSGAESISRSLQSCITESSCTSKWLFNERVERCRVTKVKCVQLIEMSFIMLLLTTMSNLSMCIVYLPSVSGKYMVTGPVKKPLCLAHTRTGINKASF